MVMALLGRSPEASALRHRLGSEICHAPHLIDAQVGNVLRRHVLREELSPSDAEGLLLSSVPMVDHRHEMTGGLARAALGVRANAGFFAGPYVELRAPQGLP